jgi:hypothetical protein
MKHPSTRSGDHIPRAPDAARMRGGLNVGPACRTLRTAVPKEEEMRIAIASFQHESNTFSTVPASLDKFHAPCRRCW